MQAHRLVRGQARRLAFGAGAAAALATAIAACGGGHGGTSSSSTASAAPSSATASPAGSPMPTTGAAAKAAIKQDWTSFFSASTTTGQRLNLLQNGQKLAGPLKSEANSSLAKGASAKVNSVTLTSPTTATVNYTIMVSGTPALKNKTGTAVYKDGVWKVGDASFCGLLGLENGSNLPAACKKATG